MEQLFLLVCGPANSKGRACVDRTKNFGRERAKKIGIFSGGYVHFRILFRRVWHFLERVEKIEKNLLYTWKVVNLNLTDMQFFVLYLPFR